MLVASLLLVQLAEGAASAQAYTIPSGKVDDVTRWLYENSPHAPPAQMPDCSNVCSELWLEEHRAIPNQPSSRRMWGELGRLQKRTGLWQRAWPLIGRASLIAGTGILGWQIGTGIRQMFVEIPEPSTLGNPQVSWTHRAGVSEGATIATIGSNAVVAPADGFKFDISGTPYFFTEQGNPGCPNLYTAPDLPAGGADYLDGVGDLSSCYRNPPGSWVQYTPKAVVPFQPAVMSAPRVRNGETPNYTESAGSDPGWSAVRDAVQSELATGSYPELSDWLSQQLDGATVPACVGLTYAACVDAVEAAGFNAHTRTYVQYAQTDLEKPAGNVIATDPAGGAEVSTATSVEIITNPAPEDYPVAIPAPEPGETYAQYVTRLQERGLVGTSVALTEATMDPDAGPNAVARVSPDPTPTNSTDVADYVPPGSTVTAYVNPPTAPVVGGGGGCEAWASPSIDLSPLADLELGDVFPFGIPGWVLGSLAVFNVTPVTPEWDFHFPFAGDGDNWHVSLEMFDPYMGSIRGVLLFAALVSMGWGFWRLATGEPDPTRDAG